MCACLLVCVYEEKGGGEDRRRRGQNGMKMNAPGGQHPTVSLACGQGGARCGTCSLGRYKGGWGREERYFTRSTVAMEKARD